MIEFSSILWKWLTVVWCLSEAVLAVVTRTRRDKGAVQDRGSQIVLWIAIAGGITAAEWLRYVVPDVKFGSAELLPITLFIFVCGFVIRTVAILSLGKAFSANVAIRETQQLKSDGLYQHVRHPSYLGLLLMLLAVALRSRNWLSLAVVLAPTTAALLWRIQIEEAALRLAFGEQYIHYSRHTKRLLPGVY